MKINPWSEEEDVHPVISHTHALKHVLDYDICSLGCICKQFTVYEMQVSDKYSC